MFEGHKEKKAQDEYEAALGRWNHHMGELQSLIAVLDGNQVLSDPGVMLKPGEVAVAKVTNVGLVEERKGAGHWQGGSQGVSIPIGSLKGRSVRYRVGTTRGHYVQGAPTPTAVDHGTMTITNQRIVYQGTSKTSECSFTKLLGIQHSPGSITISVSNRQKPTTVHYGESLDDWLTARLNVALALFHGEAQEAKDQIQDEINKMVSGKPTSP